MFHCLIIKVICRCDSLLILPHLFSFVNNFFLLFLFLLRRKRRRRDLNPRAAINDLLPFQGSPFGQLGYFSKMSYLLFSKRFALSNVDYFTTLFSTCQALFYLFFCSTNGESGIRTHAPLRTNGFQDRLVMTTSISLHALSGWVFTAFLPAQNVFYHQSFGMSIQKIQFFPVFLNIHTYVHDFLGKTPFSVCFFL